MPSTPDAIINRPLQFLHHLLVFFGIICAFATIGAFNTGGNFIVPALIAVAAFVIAAKIKYKWKHKATASVYK